MSFPKIPEIIDPSAYDAYTAYLEPTDKTRLENALQDLSETPASTQTLALKILKGDWTTLFNECDPERFSLQSLRCLKENHISFMTFATCQLFHNTVFNRANKNITVKFVSIYSQGRIDSRAKKMINETMKVVFTTFIEIRKKMAQVATKKNEHKIPTPSEDRIWTEDQESKFYDILATLPTSESCFIILPDIPYDTQIKMFMNKNDTLMQRIFYKLGFAALSSLTDKNGPLRMIPSSGMMEAFLRACYPETALTPVYRATLSTIEGLFQTLKQEGRDVIQPIDFFRDKIPEKIDDALALDRFNEERMHDFYHQWRLVQTPIVDRNLIVKISEVLLNLKKSRTTPNRYADFVFDRLVDMENIMFFKTVKNPRTRALFFPNWDERTSVRFQDPSMLVWRTLELRVLDAFKELASAYSDPEESAEDMDQILYSLINWLEDSKIYNDEIYKPMMDHLKRVDTHDEIRAQYRDELKFFVFLKHIFQERVGILPENSPPIELF